MLPRLPAAILRALLPYAERDEVLADLAAEHAEREAADGRGAARRWVWGQVLGSVPALLRRSWWRGWSGFEPRANRMRPGGPMLESWIMDARYAVRRLRARPTYTLLAVLTLALGVGGTAAIFGVARGLLLDPLPYRAEDEVAVFWFPASWTEEEFLYLRGNFPGFQQVAAYRSEDATLELSGAPARLLPGIASSSELFRVLGVRPELGRGLQAGDDAQGAEPVAVLSHGLWRELGGDPSLVGKRIRLDGVSRTVVGVMPAGFWFPDPTVRVWLAAPLDPEGRSGSYTFVGRVAPGQKVDAMSGPLARLKTMLAERFEYPEQWDKTREPSLTPVREFLLGKLRPAVLATVAAMALILLIACANVAALMLGQVEGRTTELAVRTALGADRARLTQQLVAEALLVGAVAGGIGAALAAGAFRLLVGALPLGAWAESVSLDWSVFWAAMGVALLASLLVALVPVVALWRGDLRSALGRQRTGGIGGRGGRLEGGLVVAEVALGVLMAAGAALLVRSVSNLYAIDPGVDTRGVAVIDVALGADVPTERRQQTVRELVAALGQLPGVRSAGAAQKIPLRGSGDNWGLAVVGRPDLEESTTAFRIVTPGYFPTMGIALRQGRLFGGSDRPGGERAVVVNEALARKYFPGVSPVGRLVSTGFDSAGERIVGVVEDVAEGSLTDQAEPARYMLYDQIPYAPEGNTLVLRTDRPEDAAAVLDAARRTIQRTAPGVAVQKATTMERVLAQAVGPARQVMTLLTLLTGLALVLGAVGVYGVISHFASRRRRDWGIRVALGLRPSRVVALVVRHGAALVGGGIALGIVATLVLARLLASLLYGIGAADPLALAAAAAALMTVGLVAAYVPAWRASRVDPAEVLREQ
ncbi:MAG TPA: ADOP family duplicated permease [Longimicrobium sp.]|jgi:predicted permease